MEGHWLQAVIALNPNIVVIFSLATRAAVPRDINYLFRDRENDSIKTFFKLADKIEQRYQKAKSYVDQLTQCILAKAFRGELVSQDPNDELASDRTVTWIGIIRLGRTRVVKAVVHYQVNS